MLHVFRSLPIARDTCRVEMLAAEAACRRETITLGSRVRVLGPGHVHHEFTILGPWEVDAERGIISYLSPLGQGLIGRRIGDRVTVEARSGNLSYHIEDIADGLSTMAM